MTSHCQEILKYREEVANLEDLTQTAMSQRKELATRIGETLFCYLEKMWTTHKPATDQEEAKTLTPHDKEQFSLWLVRTLFPRSGLLSLTLEPGLYPLDSTVKELFDLAKKEWIRALFSLCPQQEVASPRCDDSWYAGLFHGGMASSCFELSNYEDRDHLICPHSIFLEVFRDDGVR